MLPTSGKIRYLVFGVFCYTSYMGEQNEIPDPAQHGFTRPVDNHNPNDEGGGTTAPAARLRESQKTPAARLAILRRLHTLPDMPPDRDGSSSRVERRLLRLEGLEGNAPPEAPTLGLEIEVPAESMVSPYISSWDVDREIERLQRNYMETLKAGVPKGGDPKWEFAHDPTNYYQTSTKEVQALTDLKLLHPERDHPLHLTVGGVTSGGLHGREVNLFARVLEATGWAATGDRLLEPSRTQQTSWLGKGRVEGILERKPEEMQIDGKGVEISTFQFHGMANLERTMRAAYYLGAALKAYQKDGHTPDEAPQLSEKEMELQKIWADFSSQAGALFERFGMANPTTTVWQTEDRRSGIDHQVSQASSWHVLATLLDEAQRSSATRETSSPGHEFVVAMRELVRDTRGRSRAVIGLTAKSKASDGSDNVT